jgi:hypothetical protein
LAVPVLSRGCPRARWLPGRSPAPPRYGGAGDRRSGKARDERMRT